ncbi:hypothetical protein TREMEDRAFT_59773 [Tremella mesenterica DSM 1558]|uniref:uncharacterized protein n=1 Tax=Tremella mesenterica (strain ATCC 24925 / CBS 8224 / DSM 1558 / NBRC 9311 / NRRL Y-6157 / RJB 2259-6 / UBC 559-6) TaxID=578456 RepID=UPI0003F497B1|nr:uncharacterized protein TREMEDRAFT_59773 [Tremella mesenterica DSM 1558]EIW73599.1 hypothetical protein TREMEDRAFT_59773 [Tremella mesenterica DSM 1558]
MSRDTDEDDEMGEVDEDEENLSVDLGDPALFEDREMWVSELEKLSPVRDNEGSPEFRVRLQTSFGKKRVAYQEKMDALAEIKAEKRCRSPSAHEEVTPPSAKRVKETPRFSTGQAELFPSPSHEPGSARKASLREQDRLWKLFIDERERWEVASIDESFTVTDVAVELSRMGDRSGRVYDRSNLIIAGPVVLLALLAPARSVPPTPLGTFLLDLLLPLVSPTLRPPLFAAVSPQPKTGNILRALLRRTSPPLAPPRRHPPSVARPTLPWPDCLVSLPLLRQVRPVTLLVVLLPPLFGLLLLWLAHLVSRLLLLPFRLVPPGAVLLLSQLKRTSYSSLPPALGTRSRQPSVPPASGLSTPAPPVKTPPKSSKGKGKNKKAVQFEPAVVEDESTQLPGEILPSLDHPTIALDPRIPEEDKQLATFRSVIIGLTTQLQANRRDTAKLVEYCVKLVSAMNTLSRTMATLANSSDIGPLGRTELARVSRELTTDMSDFYRNLFDSPYLLNPTEYMLPPTLDWLRPSQPARLSSQDGAFLDILTLPADCLRTLRQLWKSPSLSVARDPALHSAHILAFNTAWKETRALRRAVGPKVTESSSGSGPAPGNEEQGGSSQQ